jgi:hypothetical protein
MITDALTSFVPIGSPLSCVGATGAAFASNVIDLLGSGAGTAPANIIGNATVFGQDVGVGGDQAELNVVVGTGFVTGDSATLNVEFQAAPDQGAAGGYEPGTWQTLIESGPLTAAQLTAGQVIFRTKFPPAFPANLNPRFLRLLFVTPSGEQFSAGTINSAIPTMVRDDQANKFAAANFKVG